MAEGDDLLRAADVELPHVVEVAEGLDDPRVLAEVEGDVGRRQPSAVPHAVDVEAARGDVLHPRVVDVVVHGTGEVVVDRDHLRVGELLHEPPDEVAADEPGTAGDERDLGGGAVEALGAHGAEATGRLPGSPRTGGQIDLGSRDHVGGSGRLGRPAGQCVRGRGLGRPARRDRRRRGGPGARGAGGGRRRLRGAGHPDAHGLPRSRWAEHPRVRPHRVQPGVRRPRHAPDGDPLRRAPPRRRRVGVELLGQHRAARQPVDERPQRPVDGDARALVDTFHDERDLVPPRHRRGQRCHPLPAGQPPHRAVRRGASGPDGRHAVVRGRGRLGDPDGRSAVAHLGREHDRGPRAGAAVRLLRPVVPAPPEQLEPLAVRRHPAAARPHASRSGSASAPATWATAPTSPSTDADEPSGRGCGMVDLSQHGRRVDPPHGRRREPLQPVLDRRAARGPRRRSRRWRATEPSSPQERASTTRTASTSTG